MLRKSFAASCWLPRSWWVCPSAPRTMIDLNPGVWDPDTARMGRPTASGWSVVELGNCTSQHYDHGIRDGGLGHLGQAGDAVVLAGNFGGVSHRTRTVPPEKALFFPLIEHGEGHAGGDYSRRRGPHDDDPRGAGSLSEKPEPHDHRS